MNPKLSYSLAPLLRATNTRAALTFMFALVCALACAPRAAAGGGDAPQWMHALVSVPLPAHDEKTNAVLLYSEEVLTVQPDGKMKHFERVAYKILRPEGKEYGMVRADFDSDTRISAIRGWCIPAQGKDYEVKEKDSVETSLFGVSNGELVSSLRSKLIEIPASLPGNIVGYEIEQDARPYVFQYAWDFQDFIPVREAHYTLQLPPGWQYRAVWMNHPEIKPVESGNNVLQWTVNDLPAVRREGAMPPWRAVAGLMVIYLLPPGGALNKGVTSWQETGAWYQNLAAGRRDASPEIKQKAADLTGSAPTSLAKMQALANFMQHEIRYVGIELGIGGYQPHSAPDVFSHRFGDCKDKATLSSSMLHEINVDSYYIFINTDRGGVSKETPPGPFWFNHVILAVRLPPDMNDPSLVAVMNHPKLGRLLIFDPTDEEIPFGQLSGGLQSNYGLLVTPDGGELIELPQEPSAMNSIQRTGRLILSAAGTLTGDVKEVLLGDRAAEQRYRMRSVMKDSDRIQPIEELLSNSFSLFQITKAAAVNLQQTDQSFGFDYSFVANNYAKNAGNLLLVRPRVLGTKSSALLETKEPRKFSVEFEGSRRDTDTFEITLPPGYAIDPEDLPPPVAADYSFASYHSKSEVNGSVLRYTRTFEIKELSVPVKQTDELKKFYRIIAGDERNTAVLHPVAK